MKFPFSKREKYFTSAEQKHLDDFLAVGLNTSDTVQNGKGEKRTVHKITYPQGIDLGSGRSVYAKDRKGDTVYHSPCATIPGKTAKILFRGGDGVVGECDSVDWLKWAGKSFTVEQPVIPEKTEAQKIKEKALVGMAARSTAPPETNDEFSKEAKWKKLK